MTHIGSIEALRSFYRDPSERAVRKQLDRLDAHCRRFIALSPFLVIASSDAEGRVDASPRGGDPGFVKVADERTVLIPDSPGNNRLDSLQNLIARPGVGMLFLIPGVDETLRINGRATLRTDEALIDLCASERRRPPLVIAVEVTEAYLHCAKALMRYGQGNVVGALSDWQRALELDPSLRSTRGLLDHAARELAAPAR